MWDCSSPTRDRTHVPGIGRQILNHWAIKRSLCSFLNVCLSLAVLGPRCCRDSLVAARRGYSLVSVLGLLIASLLLVRGFRCWLPGARAKAQQLWHPGMAVPWHMGSSQIRDQTHLLNLQADSLSLSHQESPLYSFFKMCKLYSICQIF